MGSGAMLLNKVLERKLRQPDIRLILETLFRDDKEAFLDELSDILKKLITLSEVSNNVCDSLSLDVLLKRLMDVATDAVEAYRGTIFLNDKEKNELYSRVALGNLMQDIRFSNDKGIAGAVFKTGQSIIIDDAYADPRFNPAMDKKTGYKTRNILTAPIRTKNKEIIGVIQMLNKKMGRFTESDLLMLEAVGSQASAALLNAQLYESVTKTRNEEARAYEQVGRARQEEAQLFKMTRELFTNLDFHSALRKIAETVSSLLDADRSVLFLYNQKTDELCSLAIQEGKTVEIRFPCDLGIAGTVFKSGELLNIPDIYQAPRFTMAVDLEPGYYTRSVLCVPISNRSGKAIGVIQARNKKGGAFTRVDEDKLRAFAANVSIVLENAARFEKLLRVKDYFEDILESLPSGVIVLSSDRIVRRCNSAALRILEVDKESILDRPVSRMLSGESHTITNIIENVIQSGAADVGMYAKLTLLNGKMITINLNAVPMRNRRKEFTGAMLVFEPLAARSLSWAKHADEGRHRTPIKDAVPRS